MTPLDLLDLYVKGGPAAIVIIILITGVKGVWVWGTSSESALAALTKATDAALAALKATSESTLGALIKAYEAALADKDREIAALRQDKEREVARMQQERDDVWQTLKRFAGLVDHSTTLAGRTAQAATTLARQHTDPAP